MLRIRLVVPIVVFVLTAMVAIVPSITSAADGPAGVTIHDGGDPTTWGYTPASTTVAAGQSVTWTNSGAFGHDASSTDGSWKTPLLNTGGSASITFSTPGTYSYICTPHPWMLGTIVVTAAVSAPAPDVAAVAPLPAAPTVDVAPPAIAPAASDPTAGPPAEDTAPPTDPSTGN
jgi:plastocyanin